MLRDFVSMCCAVSLTSTPIATGALPCEVERPAKKSGSFDEKIGKFFCSLQFRSSFLVLARPGQLGGRSLQLTIGHATYQGGESGLGWNISHAYPLTIGQQIIC